MPGVTLRITLKPEQEIRDKGSKPPAMTTSALSARTRSQATASARLDDVHAVENTRLGPRKPDSMHMR